MRSKLRDVLEAAVPAAFVATVAGICFSGADYVILMSIEDVAEMLGWLPAGWEDVHRTGIYIAVGVMSVLVTAGIGWWMYRTARRSLLEHDVHLC